MVDETHTMRLRVVLDGLQEVEAQAARLRSSLDNTLQMGRSAGAAVPGGAVGNDPIGQVVSKNATAERILGDYSAAARARNSLTIAENNLAKVIEKQAAETAAFKGSGTEQASLERDQITARSRAINAVDSASQVLAKAQLEEAQVARVATQTQSALNQIVRSARTDFMRRAEAERKEAAAAEANVAEGRRLQAALEQRSVAEEDAARIARKRADSQSAFSQLPGDSALSQEEVSRITNPVMREPGDTDRIYKARQQLADRILAAETAGLKFQDAINAALAGEAKSIEESRTLLTAATIGRDTANRSVVNAENQLAQAYRAASLSMAKQNASMRENFAAGFIGRRNGETPTPLMEQLGQAAKFSILYGGAYKAMFLITQTLQNTLQEGIAWQDGMTSLKIATGRNEDQLNTLANNLGRAAVAAGAAPSQGLQVGAASLGLYGVTDSSQAEQDRVATISAQVVSRLAVGSKQQPADLQGNVAAIAQALGLGAEGQFRIADLDAYMSKKFGIAQGSTLQSVSESATVGMAAGFSPEQLFAIAADLQSRTGQTDSAVAGYMAQIFSRGGEGSLTQVAQQYGVDPTQQLSDVVTQLAGVYKTADNQQRNAIAASFGRGKVQNAAVALLSDYGEVQKRSNEAAGGAATGAADKQFAAHMKNIGGELTHLSGELKDFASQLGQSGLLDAFGAGVIAFDKLLGAVDGVLRLFNELSRPVRDLILYAGLAAGAVKLLGGASEAAATEEGAGLFARGRAGTAGIFGALGAKYAAGRDAVLASQTAKASAPSVERGLAMAGMGTGLASSSEAEVQAAKAAAAAETEAGVAAEARWARTAAAYESAKGLMLSADTVRGMQSVEMLAADGTVMSNVLQPATVAGGGLIPATGARANVRGVIGAAPTAIKEAGAITAGEAAAKAAAMRAAVTDGAAALAPAAGGAAALLGTLVNPVTIAIGGLLAIGTVKGAMDRMHAATDAATAALANTDVPTATATPEQLRTQSDYLKEQAQQSRSATGWFTNAITLGQANNGQIEMAKTLEAEALRLKNLAKEADTRAAMSTPIDSSAIHSLSNADVTSGLTALQQSGASAAEQLDALKAVLFHTADAAGAATVAFSQGDFARFHAHDVVSGLLSDVKDFQGFDVKGVSGRGYTYTDHISRTEVAGKVATALTGTQAKDRLVAGMKQLGITSPADFTDDNIASLAEIVGGGVAKQALAPWQGQAGTSAYLPKLNAAILKSIRQNLRKDTQAARDALTGHGALSTSDASGDADSVVAANTNLLALRPTNDYSGRRKILEQQVRELTNLNRRGGGDVGHVIELADKARADLVQNNVDEMESLRKVAIQNAKSKKEALAKSNKIVRSEIRTIVNDGGTSDQLATVLGEVGPWAIDYAKSVIDHALKIAKAAEAAARYIIKGAQGEIDRVLGAGGGMGRPGDVIGGGSDPTASSNADRLNQQKGSLAGDASGTQKDSVSGYDHGRHTGSTKKNDTLEQIAAAHAAANAAATRSTLDDARTAVQVAQANVDAAKKHDASYWGLVATLNQAKLAYADALKAGPTNAQGESIAQVNAARAQAFATRSGGQISAARAQIASANADLSSATKDTTEWWNAMNSLFAGRQAMVQALQQFQLNRMSLGVDMTNPAQMAAVQAKAAALKLHQDLARGQSPDVIAQDRVDQRNAQANSESTAFQQRLSAMQTADELGRISHQKYMNYLDHEKERLEGIKHRTFQQQQELDQVDQVMKTAAQSMAAQWNIGDIKLPTPYMVRRYIEAQTKASVVPGGHNDGPGNGPRIHLTIETDHAHVKKIVKDESGRGARVTTTVTRRR